MSKAKLIFAVCFAVFAIGAVASTTAMAGNWMVAGTNLPNGSKAQIASPVKVLAHGKLEVPLAKVVIECVATEGTVNDALLVGPDLAEAASIVFEQCTTNNTGECSVPETISTVPVSGLATLEGPLNTLVTISPKTKNTFATIAFKGEKCALKNETSGQPVTGSVHILIHEGFDEKVEHLILVFSLPAGLKVGGDEATLSGLDADVKLTSGSPWSFL
jgi:hypothetical protein